MSARKPMVFWPGRLPFSVPTTPVVASPRWTSIPHDCSLSATICAVRRSSKAVSGWRWMSRRMAVSSVAAAAKRSGVKRVMVVLVFGRQGRLATALPLRHATPTARNRPVIGTAFGLDWRPVRRGSQRRELHDLQALVDRRLYLHHGTRVPGHQAPSAAGNL